MTVQKITNVIYALFGIIYVLIGAGALLIPTGWIPWSGDIYGGETPGLNGMHLMQEFGTVVMALGVVFLWYARRAEYSRSFHWAVTCYFAADMAIHWFGPEGYHGSLQRGLTNSVPFILMLVLGLLHPRQRAQGEVMQ